MSASETSVSDSPDIDTQKTADQDEPRSNDTVVRTLVVALLLCIVCSVFVSMAAVLLRDAQETNKALDKKRNILVAAGFIGKQDAVPPNIIEEKFKQIETKVIDFETGDYVDEVDGVPAADFDQPRAAKDPSTSVVVPRDQDVASVRRRSKFGLVYLVKDAGKLKQVILPIHGYGLWSTMYAFLAIEAQDLNTILGLVYYQDGETPGLGGEINNELWQGQFKKPDSRKRIFGDDGKILIEVIKGNVDPASADAPYEVDGLAGATITSRGVSNTFHYWLGKNGYGRYLDKIKGQLDG